MARGAVRTTPPPWRHPILLLGVAAVAFLVQAAAAFALGLTGPAALDRSTSIRFGATTYTSLSGDSELGRLVSVLLTVMICSGLAGLFLMMFGKQRGPAWGVAYLLGLPLLGMGLGSFITYRADGEVQPVSLAMAATGLVVSLLHPLAEIRHRVGSRQQAHTRAHGVTTTAQIRRVSLSTYDNVDHWVVWLQYQDATGRTFHIKHRVRTGTLVLPKVGQSVKITYDPRHPGRRSAVVVHGTYRVDRFATRPDRAGAATRTSSTKFVHWKGPGQA
jgi:hypothetical protein